MMCRALLSWLILLTALAPIANAHDARPLTVTLVEQTEGVYRVLVRIPPTLSLQDAPTLQWPGNCAIREGSASPQASDTILFIDCPGGLQGQSIRLDYPGFNPSLTALFRLQTLDGSSLSAVLPPDVSEWQVPETASWQQVAMDYTVTGVEHIWLGIDHLLFVAGLLLLARTPHRIVLAITGFTVAHSATLALATLGIVRVPVSLVEALIALSIVFLAAEIARGNSSSFSHRYPVLLSFVFGLLHGFGFASVLGDVGLPARELVTGLLFFNVGVELGQLAFIALLLVCAALARPATRLFSVLSTTPWSLIAAYALGIPATYWFMERSLVAFTG